MAVFSLKLLAADKVFYDGECASLVVPSADGQYGILANHCNAVIAVIPGVAEVKAENGEKIVAFVASGSVKIENGKVLMLVESCENAKDVNEAWAKNALKEAKDEIARKESRFNVLSAEIKIARALNRLKAKEHVN